MKSIEQIEHEIIKLQNKAAMLSLTVWFRECSKYFKAHKKLTKELVDAKKRKDNICTKLTKPI